jgi:hypothetical protein
MISLLHRRRPIMPDCFMSGHQPSDRKLLLTKEEAQADHGSDPHSGGRVKDGFLLRAIRVVNSAIKSRYIRRFTKAKSGSVAGS